MDVRVNRCLDNIVAGAVQISGLHATVAPRRQQQQAPPTLEEFVFVPYTETECLASNEKLGEQLRHCKGTADAPHLTIHTHTTHTHITHTGQTILISN